MVVGGMPNNQGQEDCADKDAAFYTMEATKSLQFGTDIKFGGINKNISIDSTDTRYRIRGPSLPGRHLSLPAHRRAEPPYPNHKRKFHRFAVRNAKRIGYFPQLGQECSGPWSSAAVCQTTRGRRTADRRMRHSMR